MVIRNFKSTQNTTASFHDRNMRFLTRYDIRSYPTSYSAIHHHRSQHTRDCSHLASRVCVNTVSVRVPGMRAQVSIGCVSAESGRCLGRRTRQLSAGGTAPDEREKDLWVHSKQLTSTCRWMSPRIVRIRIQDALRKKLALSH